jgi:hypothetical protein
MPTINDVKNDFVQLFSFNYKEYIQVDEQLIKEAIVTKLLYKLMHIYHFNGYTLLYCDNKIIKFKVQSSDKVHLIILNIKALIRKEKLKNIIS